MASGLGSSTKPLIFSVNRSRAQDEGDWKVTCPQKSSRSLEDQMRAMIPYLIAVSLFACNPAWAAAGEDDRDERSNEKSSPAAEKKSSETAKSGTPAAANPAIESELQQLRQLVQEQ